MTERGNRILDQVGIGTQPRTNAGSSAGLIDRAGPDDCGIGKHSVSNLHRHLPTSPTARLVIRVTLAGLCFVVAVVLSVLPGPAFLFWIAGFVLLGVSVGQLLLSIHAIQELVHRRLPWVERLVPRLRKHHIRRVMRHRWVRMLDTLSGRHERKRRRREKLRASAQVRRPTPPSH